jgi:4-phospho-D-threonate 3-dehydrogenase / 4-phospho-D-erythronate 3-dehydrogenase
MPNRHLAITMGDPAGIGPEIIVKACAKLRDRLETSDLKLLIIGSHRALEQANRQLEAGLEVARVGADDTTWPNLGFLQADEESTAIAPGVLSADGGRFSYKAVEQGVRLALSGRIGGIVTAPLNKEALNKAGYHYPGHTEMLAELTGARGSVMLLAHGNMRVSHVSTHVALQDVPSRLTPERLRRVIDLTHEALSGIGIATPKIAVAALNPHAGEGGLFGRQDIDVSEPTIAKAVADGLDIVGPIPGDTVFVKLRAGQYDAVVAMYHDQGHIPVKLLGFEVDPATGKWQELSGVNITLGLPIIRTSVDHGTAFDIAGKGIANERSLIEAIEYAERLAG